MSMNKKQFKDFLLIDFLVDPILFLMAWFYTRFGNYMGEIEMVIYAILMAVLCLSRIYLWLGRIVIRSSVDGM